MMMTFQNELDRRVDLNCFIHDARVYLTLVSTPFRDERMNISRMEAEMVYNLLGKVLKDG